MEIIRPRYDDDVTFLSHDHAILERARIEVTVMVSIGMEPGQDCSVDLFVNDIAKVMDGDAPFSSADVGKTVHITGDDVLVDGVTRTVNWGNAEHHDLIGVIQTVEEHYLGKVELEDGQEFENGGDAGFNARSMKFSQLPLKFGNGTATFSNTILEPLGAQECCYIMARVTCPNSTKEEAVFFSINSRRRDFLKVFHSEITVGHACVYRPHLYRP